MIQACLCLARVVLLFLITITSVGFGASVFANVSLDKLQDQVREEQQEDAQEKAAEEERRRRDEDERIKREAAAEKAARERRLRAQEAKRRRDAAALEKRKRDQEARRKREAAAERERNRIKWETWGWYAQLDLGGSFALGSSDDTSRLVETDSSRQSLLLGCCKDVSSGFNLVPGISAGLRLLIDDKTYEYSRSSHSSSETASASASGYGLLLRYNFFGFGFNEISHDDSLQFDTIIYNPGTIRENFLGIYSDFGEDFYNLSLGLEFVTTDYSTNDELIAADAKLALIFGLGLINN